ncbi:MAG TPA: MCE family protein [Actinomycetota bacterium]|nr:MCE family protein [Actinomycetota bacterium]
MTIRTFRERSPLLVGILSIIGVAGATTFAFYLDRLPFVKQVYKVNAEFADAAGLNVENQVRVAGIKVGTVSKIELDGDRVLVEMEIANDIEIPSDAEAEIKLATILGTKFVEIDGAGGPPFLEKGDTIPLERTAIPYEIYQAANQGTEIVEDIDGEALNELLVELTKLTEVAEDEIGSALSGLNELGTGLNARSDELASLIKGAENLTGVLSEDGDDIVRLIDASNDVLGVLSSQREELQSLLESTRFMAGELTSVIRNNRANLDSILDKLHNALVVLEKNVEHLDVALEWAGPSSRYFGSVLTQGRWADIYVCALVLTTPCEAGSR